MSGNKTSRSRGCPDGITLAEACGLARLPAEAIALALVGDDGLCGVPEPAAPLPPRTAAAVWLLQLLGEAAGLSPGQQVLAVRLARPALARLDDAAELEHAAAARIELIERRWLRCGAAAWDLRDGRHAAGAVPPAPVETIAYDLAALYDRNAAVVVAARAALPQEA